MLHQEDSLYKDNDEYQTDDSIESNMSMDDDDNGKKNDRLNAVVTKANISAMDRKLINNISNIASHFANVTLSLREPKTNAQKIYQMCGIGIDKSKKFVSTTTQRSVCNVSQPLSQQFRTRQSLFRKSRFRGRVYTDTMFGIKSMRGNKISQIFVTDFGDIQVFPMHSKKDSHKALLRFFRKQAYQHQYTLTTPKNLALKKDGGTLWKNT